MKNMFLLCCCILLLNCNGKSKNTQKEILEYHNFSNIKLNGFNTENVFFEFIYNNENYKINFFGKDSINSIRILKNNEVDENFTPLMLEFEKDKFIIEELNKSSICSEMNKKTINDINLMNIFYANINVSVIPTDKLVNYLKELIDLYYMPLYTVQENDTLSSICLKLYGNTNYEQIIKYNPELKMGVLNQYFVVHPNQKIRIKIE